jgi:hypothetical protein
MITIDSSKLPMLVKITGKGGSYVQFILRAGTSKLGAQLIKLDPKLQQLLAQC